ncbi:MAG: FHA domain-containing protein [Acidimicrobiales bacterium]
MPGLDGHRVRPVAGDGLVVRVPGLVAVIGPGPGDGPTLVAEACRLAATDGPSPAAAISARLATLAAADLRPLPAVAVVADGSHGLEAVVHGSAAVRSGPTTVRASDGTVVARPLSSTAPFELRLDPADGAAGAPDAELTAGTVAGGGALVVAATPRLTLTTARAPVAPPTTRSTAAAAPPVPSTGTGTAPPAPPGPRPDAPGAPGAPASPRAPELPAPGFRSVLLVPDRGTRPEARPPLPIAGAAARVAPEVGPSDGPPILDGVLCDLGHLNDVAAARCRECGMALSLADGRRHTGPRPPLGLLLFEGGASYLLDTDYVIGRAPADDPLVVAGRARPLVLDDAERTVSRVHAEVRLEGWHVVLSDRGSTNGTFWWDGTAGRWVRLVPAEPRRLQPGDRAAIGRQVLTLETRTTEAG